MKFDNYDEFNSICYQLFPNQRKNQIKKTYGLVFDDFVKLLWDQNLSCAICGRQFLNLRKDPSIDHNHETGKVRGILCRECNLRIIPVFEHYTHLFERTKKYLDGCLTIPRQAG